MAITIKQASNVFISFSFSIELDRPFYTASSHDELQWCSALAETHAWLPSFTALSQHSVAKTANCVLERPPESAAIIGQEVLIINSTLCYRRAIHAYAMAEE